MLALVPDWSDRAIAKHIGVGHAFVSRLHADPSLSTVDSEKSAERTYTTKHGTKAAMDTSGQKKAGAAKKMARQARAHDDLRHRARLVNDGRANHTAAWLAFGPAP